MAFTPPTGSPTGWMEWSPLNVPRSALASLQRSGWSCLVGGHLLHLFLFLLAPLAGCHLLRLLSSRWLHQAGGSGLLSRSHEASLPPAAEMGGVASLVVIFLTSLVLECQRVRCSSPESGVKDWFALHPRGRGRLARAPLWVVQRARWTGLLSRSHKISLPEPRIGTLLASWSSNSIVPDFCQ